MNTQSSVHSWAIAFRLFLASRSPNTSWRLRLMEGLYGVRHSSLACFPLNDSLNPARTSRRCVTGSAKNADDHPLLDLSALRISSANSLGCSKAAKRGRVRRRLSCASPVLATTTKRAECGAQFLDEYGGLLKGREMSAVGCFVPIEESRIDPLAPQSRR